MCNQGGGSDHRAADKRREDREIRCAIWIVKSTVMLREGGMPQQSRKVVFYQHFGFGSGRAQGMGRHAPREECPPPNRMLQHSYLHATRLDPESFTRPLTTARTSVPKAVPYSLPISSETNVCIWLSVLFCGLYSAATGGAREPTLPLVFGFLYKVYSNIVLYRCVCE